MDFRFRKHEIVTTLGALERIRDQVVSGKEYVFSGFELLCPLLDRRYLDLENMFGRSFGALGRGYIQTVEYVYKTWARPLPHSIYLSQCFIQENAENWLQSIYHISEVEDNCIGFVDGARLFISTPSRGLQRFCSSGHKRCHSLLFLSIVSPDGIHVLMYGPLEGRRHDMFAYAQSDIDNELIS